MKKIAIFLFMLILVTFAIAQAENFDKWKKEEIPADMHSAIISAIADSTIVDSLQWVGDCNYAYHYKYSWFLYDDKDYVEIVFRKNQINIQNREDWHKELYEALKNERP